MKIKTVRFEHVPDGTFFLEGRIRYIKIVPHAFGKGEKSNSWAVYAGVPANFPPGVEVSIEVGPTPFDQIKPGTKFETGGESIYLKIQPILTKAEVIEAIALDTGSPAAFMSHAQFYPLKD